MKTRLTPHRFRVHAKGFTLIEILTVVFIVVLLLAITIGAFGWVETRKREESTKIIIKRIATELESYYADEGTYPDGNGNEASTNALYSVLFGDYENSGAPGENNGVRNTVYYGELNPKQQGKAPLVTKIKNKYIIVDAWGAPLRYSLGFQEKDTKGGYGTGMNPSYDLWSMGADGKQETDPYKEGPANRDNITNVNR